MQVYSLIAQKDSRINLGAARDQQRIAEATQRDSQQVKIITVITLVFLPATLLAVRLVDLDGAFPSPSCHDTSTAYQGAS